LRQQIKGAHGGVDLGGGDAQIVNGGRQAAMTQKHLAATQVGSGFQKVDGKAML
jgi:hypothetical protein